MSKENFDITKPFANFHACRLKPPNYPKYAYKECEAKHDNKCIDFVYGISAPNKSELQSMRYNKKIWMASAAKAHCKDKKGSFEPASESSDDVSTNKMEIFLKSEGQYVKKEMTDDEFLNWFKSNSDEEGNVKEDCLLYKKFEIDDTEEKLTFVMSDFTLDRDFERIDPAGWDLKAYKKNNVLLWGHDRSLPAIGLMEKVRVKDEKLLGEPIFDEEDEFALKIKKKVDKRIIKSGSVGFWPIKVEIIEDENDKTKLIYRKQELREFSLCNVPANPNAVIIEPGKSSDIKPELEERIERLENDIEDLKEMQITLSEKIDKKEVNPLDSLFKKKRPQPQDLQTFFDGKRSIDHNPISQ